MKAKTNLLLRAARHSISTVVIVGAVLLIVAGAQAQNLFVAGFFTGDIYEITPGGAQSTFASGLTYPIGLAFDSAGNLFVADNYYGNIYKYTPGGTRNTFATGLDYPFGLAFDSAGNLFVADQGTGTGTGAILKFTPDGTKSTFASGLTSPLGLAFNSAGDLFVAEYNNGAAGTGTICVFTPDGGATGSNSVYGLNSPVGLAFNAAGDLFESDSGSGNIYEFTPTGVQSTFASGLSFPGALAFNNAGDLFVASDGGIIEFMPDGTQIGTKITFSGTGTEGFAFQPTPELKAAATNGAFQVAVSMPSPYHSTILQVSTDMVNWINVYTNTPPFTFTDSMTMMPPRRFYRATLAP